MKKQASSYYKTLGLEPHASHKDIRTAYRKMALRWHPDRNPDNRARAEESMRDINEAYSHLKNPIRRSLYDRWLNKYRINDNICSPSMNIKPFPWADLKSVGWSNLAHSVWPAAPKEKEEERGVGKDQDHG